MLSLYAETMMAKLLGYGAAVTAVLVVSGTVTDPVNTPKLLSLGIVGAAAIGLFFASWSQILWNFPTTTVLISVLFILGTVNATIFSDSPLSQNIYGTYGRNNGLLAYIFLVFVFLAASVLSKPSSFETIIKSLLVAGTVNIAYCGWVILFGDFIGWNNPYGNILGTFGNPNFIGSFLGIFLSAYTAYTLAPNRSKAWKLSLLFVVPVTMYEIVDSSAIQGRVVAVGGLALVFLTYLRFRVKKLTLIAYSIVISISGLLAALGALQIGPLTDCIYKTSVSLRGQYWLAGWSAGAGNPLNGVGMDALGDWYRRVRDPQALVLPGVNTVVNTAHNVFMDMFSFGGVPLLFVYVVLVIYSGFAMIRFFIRLKQFDGNFTALAVAWIGYQAQSIISINQIGLAIWGWLLSGTLIGYERVTRLKPKDKKTISAGEKTKVITKKSSSYSDSRTLLLTSASALIGLLIAIPPFSADTKWKSSLTAGSLPQLEASMQASYFNPPNVEKYLRNIQLLEESRLPDLAHKYALRAADWNGQSYDVWRMVYFISKSTPAERDMALKKMKELDPLNPDVTALK